METAPTASRPRVIGLRVVGIALILLGLWAFIGLVSTRLAGLGSDALPLAGPGKITLIDIWQHSSPWANVEALAFGALALFAGVQLVRVKRSGWIVGVVVLTYTLLSLGLFLITDQVKYALMKAHDVPIWDGPAGVSSVFSHQADAARSLSVLFIVAYSALLVTALEGSDLLFARPGGKRSKLRVATPVLALIAVAVAAGWLFGGAEYVAYREALAAASTPQAFFSHKGAWDLSAPHRAEVNALYQRRCILETAGCVVKDLSQPTPEEVAGIIKASRTIESSDTRSACYDWLAEINTPEAQRALVDAICDKSNRACSYALSSMRDIELLEVPDVLLEQAGLPGEDGYYATQALGHSKDPRALKRLIELSTLNDIERRLDAIGRIGLFPVPEAETALQRALADSNLEVRGSACWGLERIGGASSVPFLISILKGRDDAYEKRFGSKESLHDRAAEALSRITGRDKATDADAWEAWWKEAGPTFDLKANLVARLMAPMPPTLPDKDTEEGKKARTVKVRALSAIESRNLRETAPQLASYMRSSEKEPIYAWRVAQILSKWGYREGIEYLIRMMATGEPMQVQMAMRSLHPFTGVNFFDDNARWQAWWKENRDRFPSAAEAAK